MRWKLAIFFGLIFFLSLKSYSQQENSPYSRYGLGDKVNTTNIISRGMGGVSAGYRDNNGVTINYNNPATFSAFASYTEPNSKKSFAGRMIFDAGVNWDIHSIREPNSTDVYTSSNLYVSHLQVAIPLKQNWGMSFGLRQLTRIDYKINRLERLYDPNTGVPIDSTLTEFSGTGGSYLAGAGTGVKIKNLSVGVNLGYVFGKKDVVTKRAFVNDTVDYAAGNFSTNTGFGGFVATGGLQYDINFSDVSSLRIGAFGNLQHNINANTDRLRETFSRTTAGDVRIDSVFETKDVKGKIIYPSSYTAGFLFTKGMDPNKKIYRAWSFGVDYSVTQWDNFRFYGLQDSVTNSSMLSVGAEFHPDYTKKNYLNQMAYRFGFYTGKDYIKVGKDLPVFGLTFGLGVPLRNWNAFNKQVSIINLAFEYTQRGNNSNTLKDNIFRISAGFSFSDIWFQKKKYE